jgi:hypothetical protein
MWCVSLLVLGSDPTRRFRSMLSGKQDECAQREQPSFTRAVWGEPPRLGTDIRSYAAAAASISAPPQDEFRADFRALDGPSFGQPDTGTAAARSALGSLTGPFDGSVRSFGRRARRRQSIAILHIGGLLIIFNRSEVMPVLCKADDRTFRGGSLKNLRPALPRFAHDREWRGTYSAGVRAQNNLEKSVVPR